jgi:hypothetical protein
MHPDLWNEPPEFFRWLARAKARGFCTYDELSEVLYQSEWNSLNKIHSLHELLTRFDIEVRDTPAH